MPVAKFKNISDMPPTPRVQGPELIERIRALWNRAFALSPPDFSRGVIRFRTITDANRARFDRQIARMRRTASSAPPLMRAEDGTRGRPPASDRCAANFRSGSATELLQRLNIESPELVRAADEVDQTLLDRAAKLSPLERVEAAS